VFQVVKKRAIGVAFALSLSENPSNLLQHDGEKHTLEPRMTAIQVCPFGQCPFRNAGFLQAAILDEPVLAAAAIVARRSESRRGSTACLAALVDTY